MKDKNVSTFGQWRTKMSQPIVFCFYLRLQIISVTVVCSLCVSTNVTNATDFNSDHLFMKQDGTFSDSGLSTAFLSNGPACVTPKTCDDIICHNNNICRLSLVNGTQRNDAHCVCLGEWAGLRCQAKLHLTLREILSDSVTFEVKGMTSRPPVQHFSLQELHVTNITLVIWNLNKSDHCLILQKTEIQSTFLVHGLEQGQGYVVCTVNGLFESCSIFYDSNFTFQSNCLQFETRGSEKNPFSFGILIFTCVLTFLIFITLCYMYSKRHTLLVQFILNIFCFRNCYCLRKYSKRRHQHMHRQREVSSDMLMPPDIPIDFSSSTGLFECSHRPAMSSKAMSSKASSSGSRRSAFSMDVSFTSTADPNGFLYENQGLIKPIYSSQNPDILKLTYLEEDLLPLSCDQIVSTVSSPTNSIPFTFSDVEFYSNVHSIQQLDSKEFSFIRKPLNGHQSFQNVNHYRGADNHCVNHYRGADNHCESSQNPIHIKISKHPQMNSKLGACSSGKKCHKYSQNEHSIKINYQRPDPFDPMETKALQCFRVFNSPQNTKHFYYSNHKQNSEDNFLKRPVQKGINGYQSSSFPHSSRERIARKANSFGQSDEIFTNQDNDNRFSTLPLSKKTQMKQCIKDVKDNCNVDHSYTLPREWKTPKLGKGPIRPTYLSLIPSSQIFPVAQAITKNSTLVSFAQPTTRHVKNLINQFEHLHFFKQTKSKRCTDEEEEFRELQSPLAEDRSKISKKQQGSNLSRASTPSTNSLASIKKHSCKTSPVFEGHPSQHLVPPFSQPDEYEAEEIGSYYVSDTEDMSFMSTLAETNNSVISCFDDDSSNLVTPFDSGSLSNSDDDTYKNVNSLTGSLDTLQDFLTESINNINTFEKTSRWMTSQSSDDSNKHTQKAGKLLKKDNNDYF